MPYLIQTITIPFDRYRFCWFRCIPVLVAANELQRRCGDQLAPYNALLVVAILIDRVPSPQLFVGRKSVPSILENTNAQEQMTVPATMGYVDRMMRVYQNQATKMIAKVQPLMEFWRSRLLSQMIQRRLQGKYFGWIRLAIDRRSQRME
jgi:hypothetical protein